MNSDKNIQQFFESKTPQDVEIFVKWSLDISDFVVDCLDTKGWTQKDLANNLGKSESEISKWLSGTHNLTLRSIAKLSASLGKEIISIPDPIATKQAKIVKIKHGISNESYFIESQKEALTELPDCA